MVAAWYQRPAGAASHRLAGAGARQRHVLDLAQSDSPTSELATVFVEIVAARAG